MNFVSYRALDGQPAAPAALDAERACAARFGRVALGTSHLFLGRILGLGGRYISYPSILRWYIRQCEAQVEVSTFYSYMFVIEFMAGGKEQETAVNFEEKKKIDALRSAFSSAHPEIPFGRIPGKKSRYNW